MDEGTTVTTGPVDEQAVASGLARFAQAIVSLAAGEPRCLAPGGELEQAAEGLRAGWSLAALAPVGAPLMRLLELDGARVEVLADALYRRRYSAARRPLGVRSRAMGEVVDEHGARFSLSCRLVLRVPRAVACDPRLAALALVFHGALHADERARLPGGGLAAVALEEVGMHAGVPHGSVPAPAWGHLVCRALAQELGVVRLGLVDALLELYSES